MENFDFIEKVRPFLVALLITVGVSVGIFVFVGAAPDSIVSINPAGDTIATVAGVLTGMLCCPGIICIFVKKIRLYVIIALAFVLLLFLSAVCLNGAYERLNYTMSKDTDPVKRMVVITHHNHHHNEWVSTETRTKKGILGDREVEYEEHHEVDKYEMTFRFLDNGKEISISKEEPYAFYNKVAEGDTCIAYILKGALGLDYVADMRVKSRGR